MSKKETSGNLVVVQYNDIQKKYILFHSLEIALL